MLSSRTQLTARFDERDTSVMPVHDSAPRYTLRRPGYLARQLMARRNPPTLDRWLIDEILAAYGWKALGEAEAPAGAGRSTSVLVQTADGKKLLKRHKSTVDPEAIVHEHSILQHLARIGVPAPRVNAALNGATLIQHHWSCYAVFDALEGYTQYHQLCLLPAQKARFIEESGAALGTLHSTLKGFIPAGHHPHGFRSRAGDRVHEIEWFIDALDWCRRSLPDLKRQRDPLAARLFAGEAEWLAAQVWKLDDQLKAADLPRLIIHGDYGPYNLFFKPGAPIVILDFELARLDWRLTDLATALPSFARNRLGFNPPYVRAFLSGYQAHCPIERDELALLPAVWRFLTLRRVIVLWQRYWQTGARSWLEDSRRKLTLATWIAEHQQTLTRWLVE